MMIKVFRNTNLDDFEKEVNNFLDKEVAHVSSIDYGTYVEDDVTYFVAYMIYE